VLGGIEEERGVRVESSERKGEGEEGREGEGGDGGGGWR